MVSERLGVKRHTACWKVGELCNMSDWQYSMTLAQIYKVRRAVTKILAPQTPHLMEIQMQGEQLGQSVKLQQSHKS